MLVEVLCDVLVVDVLFVLVLVIGFKVLMLLCFDYLLMVSGGGFIGGFLVGFFVFGWLWFVSVMFEVVVDDV